jgi:crotonobetainyl-CoA:carnitine CoA-transferase CaiB-like acyl-CoA transferase
MAQRPLNGVRVLDLSRLLPGPFCSLILSDLGAEVVKLEDPRVGDYLRAIGPRKRGLSGAFYALNRGKRSLAVDLKRPEGRELLLRLLPGYRVLLESFRPGVLQRLGLGFDELQRAHPELILCSISGYGQDGPLRERAGHDINYLALAGVLAAGGEPGGRPALPGVQLADLAGGALWATIRILAALQSGKGCHLDVSMTEGVMSLLLPWLGDHAFGGPPLRRGQALLNGGAACYGTYATSDGGQLSVGAIEPKFWMALCRELGLPGRATDAVAPAGRQRDLRQQLQRLLALEPLSHWQQRLERLDACVEPMLEMEQLADHPQHRERGVFRTLDDPERGPLSLPRLPLDTEPRGSPAPRLGQHTDEVLAEAGLSGEEIQRLREQQVIG